MAKQQTVAPEVGFTAVTPKGEGVITEKNTGWFTVQIGDDEFKFRGKDLKCYAEEAKLGSVGDEDESEDGVRIRADLEHYNSVKAASGNRSYDSGDDVAVMLRGQDLDAVYKIAARELKAAGETITIKALKERYENLNPGHQRMCVGNRVRAARARALQAEAD